MKPLCPQCGSNEIVYNGRNPNGKQKYKCKNCRHQYVENPDWKEISKDTKETIKKLLIERITLAGISRSVGVSKTWLQKFANKIYENVDREIKHVKKKSD